MGSVAAERSVSRAGRDRPGQEKHVRPRAPGRRLTALRPTAAREQSSDRLDSSGPGPFLCSQHGSAHARSCSLPKALGTAVLPSGSESPVTVRGPRLRGHHPQTKGKQHGSRAAGWRSEACHRHGHASAAPRRPAAPHRRQDPSAGRRAGVGGTARLWAERGGAVLRPGV